MRKILVFGLTAFMPAAAAVAACRASFDAARAWLLPQDASELVLADVDGDGLSDAIASGYGSTSLLLRRADGTFAPPQSLGNGNSAAVGRFTGDGRLGFALAVSSSIVVVPRNADGTLGAQILTPAPASVATVVAADFDGDGISDVVALARGVRHFRGRGDGTFHDPVTYEHATSEAALLVADFTGDARPDVAVQGFGPSLLLVNEGSAFRLTVLPTRDETLLGLTAADFDGDGRIDLAGSIYYDHDAMLLRNTGGGTFQATYIPVRYGLDEDPLEEVAAGDVDADGDADLIIRSYYEPWTRTLINDGTAHFTLLDEPYATPLAFALEDMDGDGLRDLIGAGEEGRLSVLRNRGGGRFATPRTLLPAGVRARTLATADLDGDGAPELLSANTYGDTVSTLFNDGHGTFDWRMDYDAEARVADLDAADVNGDGGVDVAIARGDQIGIMLNRQGALFRPVWYPAGGVPDALALADLDGDGRRDVIAVRADDPSRGVTVLRGLPGGGFSAPSTANAGTRLPMRPLVHDFDHNGRVDLVLPSGSGPMQFLAGRTSGFAAPVSLGESAPVAVAADWNSDGRLDLIVASGGRIGILRGNGNATFTVTDRLQTDAYNVVALSVADFDADGRLDVFYVDTSHAVGTLATGKADGTLSRDLVHWATVSSPSSVVAGDWNGDGKTDLAVGGEGTNVLTLYANDCVPTGDSVAPATEVRQ